MKQAKPSQPSMKELREAERKRLAQIAELLEKAGEDARKPGSPLNRELSVRAGQRLVGAVLNQARALTQIGTPDPWMTHPTRERVARAGEEPLVTVAPDKSGVSHRWNWPVQRAHDRHQLNPGQYMAAARFRRAFFDKGDDAGTMAYGEEGRASDPATRNPITPKQEEAAREFAFVWKRLENEMRALAWVLVLQQPLPNDAEPLTIVEFGRRIGHTNTEDHARWFAFGAMKMVLVRLTSVYQIFDAHRGRALEEADAKAEAERKEHRRRVNGSRIAV